MKQIRYIDRVSGQEEEERIYGRWALALLYGNNPFFRVFSFFLLPLLTRLGTFSHFYGWLQKKRTSRKKIQPFIDFFGIDSSEFQKKVSEFDSFNDFFIRKLHPRSRPIASGEKTLSFFADGRYLFYPDLKKADRFFVKGKEFSLAEFLQDKDLASKYESGTMIMARLCPTDYHRFHFPCDCTPGKAKLINGALFSVNPWALEKNIRILMENKRMLTELETKHFGKVLYVEIGATNVGSIVQTYRANQFYSKGGEKGYFSFGGSCVIVLFEKGRIELDPDLIFYSEKKVEVRGLFGQSFGSAKKESR